MPVEPAKNAGRSVPKAADVLASQRPIISTTSSVTERRRERLPFDHMALAPTSRELVCPACARIVYPKICPGVICAVTSCDGDDEEIVLTRYAGRTTALWALVAGFTEIGESLEGTVRREVMVPSLLLRRDVL